MSYVSFLDRPGFDAVGKPLEAGRMYSVFQTNDSPGGGILAWWNGKTFVDADALDRNEFEECDLSGEYCHGVYEFAFPQAQILRGADLELVLAE